MGSRHHTESARLDFYCNLLASLRKQPKLVAVHGAPTALLPVDREEQQQAGCRGSRPS